MAKHNGVFSVLVNERKLSAYYALNLVFMVK